MKFKRLPPVLAFHLKRFAASVDTTLSFGASVRGVFYPCFCEQQHKDWTVPVTFVTSAFQFKINAKLFDLITLVNNDTE